VSVLVLILRRENASEGSAFALEGYVSLS